MPEKTAIRCNQLTQEQKSGKLQVSPGTNQEAKNTFKNYLLL